MDRIHIIGGNPLYGSVAISGAKNACLTLAPAALLTDEALTLTNVPRLADIKTMDALLSSLGTQVSFSEDRRVMTLKAESLTQLTAEYDIVRKMRASILVLGPMLARAGAAKVSLPGGCAIGARPVDLHLSGLQAMGAEIQLADGYITAKAPKTGLQGARIVFPMVSVGATENLLMAASLAKGETELVNAACEPEIIDLADCLRAMGAKITGDGTSNILIQGVDRLHAATHRVLTDRIELGTYMIAPALAGGELELIGGRRDLAAALIERLEAANIAVTDTENGLKVRCRSDRPTAVDINTAPYPGYATDLQAQFMTLMTLAEGTACIRESIFENRFMHVPELLRMGADIQVDGSRAYVKGVKQLRGAQVMASDLRASASLVLAGLAAQGETIVNRVYHLDRGYERVEDKLSACGAQIHRESL